MKKNNINNLILSKLPKKLNLNNKLYYISKTKYLPSFTKEWKDTVYSYNKNTIKNIPSNHFNINKIIQSYFNLYIISVFKNKNKNRKEITKATHARTVIKKRKIVKKISKNRKILNKICKSKILNKIHVSNPDIKYTNNKAIITLFTLGKKKNYLYQKYITTNINTKIYLIQRYLTLYKKNILRWYNALLNKHMYYYLLINKSIFIQYKLTYLKIFILLKTLYSKKIWSKIINNYLIFLSINYKHELQYSLNQLKFNKWALLNKLSILLNKILGKKVEYNIINLKSILFNSDIFTQVLNLKLRKKKFFNYKHSVLSVINKAEFAICIFNKKKEKIENYEFINKKYPTKNIHKKIFYSIQYKNLKGIRIETKGRLTKRYRADRSVFYKKFEGGLQKTSLNTTLFRGNINPNISYSVRNNRRRIGSFAIKGWISGKE